MEMEMERRQERGEGRLLRLLDLPPGRGKVGDSEKEEEIRHHCFSGLSLPLRDSSTAEDVILSSQSMKDT